MESSSSNFVELSWSELTETLEELVQHQSEVKLWQKDVSPDLCKIVNGHLEEEDEKTQQLRLSHEKIDSSWKDREFFIQFAWSGIEYFSKGKVIEVLGNHECWFEMNPHVFRVEKRENERVSTFPSLQVYAYFKLAEDQGPSNVVFLNKHIEEDHSIFKKFEKLTKKEILEAQDSMESDKNDQIIGFRVLDISSNGVSFLVNEEESELFAQQSQYEFTLLLEGEVFYISNAKIVYNVDYVNPRAGNASMYKVGLNFELNQKLGEKVQQLIKDRDEDDKVLKDFENFAK